MKLANSTYLHSIKDANNIGFKASDYSKFKYGDISIANKFGDDLFKYFIEKKKDIFKLHTKINIYSSPFDFLPTSSYYLTKRFFDNLIHYIKINNLNISVEFSKIERQQTYTQDYGAMNAEERFNLIKNDTYELKKKPSTNSLLIFIDDVSITGTHQKVIELLLNKNKILNDTEYLYFAKLTNNKIPPNFENKINNSFVNNEDKLLRIINSDNFRLTTRTVKYILGLETIKVMDLIDQIDANKRIDLLREIYIGSLNNKYDKINTYKKNILHIFNVCDTNLSQSKNHKFNFINF